MKKLKKRQPMPIVNMKSLKIDFNEYLLLTIRKDAIAFVVDNAMQYLVYKVPAYENWVTNDELENWGKLEYYLSTRANEDQYRTSGCKLPDGKWKVIGMADENGFDDYVKQAELNPETTLVLQLTA